MLFGKSTKNYGHAGQVYAQYCSTHFEEIAKRIHEMFTKLGETASMKPAERIWFAVMTSLVVGAQIANASGITTFDVKSLGEFLIHNLKRLRGRSHASMQGSKPDELVQAYMQQHQDKALLVESFQKPGQSTSYDPMILKSPKADRIVYQYAKLDGVVRVSKTDFTTWLLRSKGIRWANIAQTFADELEIRPVKVQLGLGTSWQLPRSLCLDITIG